MTATNSTMLPLHTPCPDFELLEPLSGKTLPVQDFSDQPLLLVAFICNHCPFVRHLLEAFVQLARDYQTKGVAVIAISSNDAETYPDDAPPRMAQLAQELSFTFPYLYDETQEVARRFNAVCTPEFYLFDQDRRLCYRGCFDQSTPKNALPVTGSELQAAMDAFLQGKPVPEAQIPSIGCNIKWRPN